MPKYYTLKICFQFVLNRTLKLTSCLSTFIFVFLTSFLWSQTVIQEITATCGTPIAFTDPGGSGGGSPYGPNQHYVYKICPGTGSMYASVSLTGISLGSNDHITVINGGSSQAPYLTTITGNAGNLTFTSSSPDHCLTLVFSSDASNQGNGWGGTINCAGAAGNNTNICQETDCVGGCARTVCGSGTYTWQNDGDNMLDLNTINAGCLTNYPTELERNHVWYYINPQSPGTLEVLIESGAGGQIYDFALWKSYDGTITCPALNGNDPILCEAENNGSNGTTPQGSGFSSSPWIDSDNPTNQPYSAYPGYEPALNITQADIDAGIVLMLLINVRSNGTPQPVVNISMDGTASLNCTPLAVELVDFFGFQKEKVNELVWTTMSEQDNSHFIIERSINAMDWEYLALVYGAGNSTQPISYRLEDSNPFYPLTYYRLKQYDINGEATQYKTISLARSFEDNNWISSLFPNPAETYVNLIHNDPDTENPLILELYNAMGQLVLQQTHKIETKNTAITLDLSVFSNGLYTLKCVQGEKLSVQKLMVQDK